MVTIEQMIQREMLCCMSSLVSTLAGAFPEMGYGQRIGQQKADVAALCDQAVELAWPVLDYEEAARQAGWASFGEFKNWSRPEQGTHPIYSSAEVVCLENGIDPYEWEVYEHWAISQWFAERLQAHGERVDTDFAGLNIWARTATGQAISMDGVVQKIYREMVKA